MNKKRKCEKKAENIGEILLFYTKILTNFINYNILRIEKKEEISLKI